MAKHEDVKTVTLTVSLSVQVTGKDDKELLERAKVAFVEKLQKEEFPRCTYTIADGEALSSSELVGGTIAYLSELKVHGQIFGVNSKTVSFVCKDGRRFNVPPGGLTKSNATIEDVFVPRPDWMRTGEYGWEGYNGYLKVKDEYIPVMVGKKKGKTTPVYIINGKGKGYSLTDEQHKMLVDEIPSKKK
jgi:hypothetical protein